MIAITTQNFAPDIGGMQAYLTGLADALAQKGHTVSVYCDAPRQASARCVPFDREYEMVRFGGPPPWRRWRKARAVARRILSGAVSAVVADSWKSIEYLPHGTKSHTRIVCLAHGAEFLVQPQSAKGRRIGSALAKADLVAANSRFTAELVRPFLKRSADLAVVMPGVNAPLGAAAEYRTKQADSQRLISIARLDPYKGIDAVLRVLPQLRKAFPQLRYDIIGDGKDRERLIAMQRDLGIADIVRFHGRASEQQKSELLNDACLFVLPNRDESGEVEGFGLVFAEASAFGLPCIGGNSGGVSDAIVDGKTGLLVDGCREDEIEAALRRLLTDHGLAEAMARAAHARFWAEFAWPAAIGRFEKVLRLAQ